MRRNLVIDRAVAEITIAELLSDGGYATAFNLLTDPKVEYPATGLRETWVAEPAMKLIVEFEESLKKYPPIAAGTPDPYQPPEARQ